MGNKTQTDKGGIEMEKHTPHEWEAVKRAPRVVKVEVRALDLRSVIAEVRDNDLCPEHGGGYESNARLIAAAPDLLEMLKAVRSGITWADYPELLDEVDAAIAKAEGRN